ncbi:AAA family ATPase [Micromonospora sp. WMMD1120]|uniref:helix-turn-helix transcriptional regulator n=1 Tax=Micromonospora sp. WMMD1120 TaxID=3016106 RepID=UPI002417BB17|nr:LuxR family transcriptional regulator [Micromonospora sp. WMMD1120]MDG4808740.1 AAA family ATPase [Micromonospora sp. WMMD1120]
MGASAVTRHLRDISSKSFVARKRELAGIASVTDAAGRGRGGALLVLGDAGIGKSTLIDEAAARLHGWRVLRATGVEFESELPYAALHQLCAPLLDHRAGLPAPQRRALDTVFGLHAGATPSPMLVGLAVLGLLSAASRRGPVICAIDDVQWIDAGSRQVLAFVSARVATDRIAMVFAARDAAPVPELGRLPALTVGALTDSEALTLLRYRTPLGPEAAIVQRVLSEAAGNPLALVEFARDAGPFGLPGDATAGTVERRFASRFLRLPAPTRAVLALAAAEPTGDLALLRRAMAIQGLDAADLAAAEDSGLVVAGPRVHFRHPLARSAVYRSSSARVRRRAHAALAAGTDATGDPDRRAWHQANAISGPDEETAAELERSAGRAQRRGGFAAGAAFFERAARLTPDRSRQARRLLAAARERLASGAPSLARELVDEAERLRPDQADRHAARLLRAMIDYHVTRSIPATIALIDAADGVGPDEVRETYLEAFASLMFSVDEPGRLRRLALHIRERVPRRQPPRPVDLLLQALVEQNLRPVDEAMPVMRRTVDAFRERARAPDADPWWMERASVLSVDLGDSDAMEEITDRQVELARAQGAYAILPHALRFQAVARTIVGRFADAELCIIEARAVDEAAGTSNLVGSDLMLAAWRGDAARFREIREKLRGWVGVNPTALHYANGVLCNGSGDHETALDALLLVRDQHRAGAYTVTAFHHELVEAAAYVGRPEEAKESAVWIGAVAQGNPNAWTTGAHLLACALLDQGLGAQDHYRSAISRFADSRMRVHYARARLLYGEWLRRVGRRTEARVELRAAHDLLATIGARGFAARAARELDALGEPTLVDDADPLAGLTARELLVARKVASGAGTKEVAALLFVSPRTIDAHLRNLYRKLGISSRRQLRELLR